jgi:isoquinoline 1-oxidoreductase
MMADELDVELEKVKIVMGDTALCPYDAGTWGSLTTRQFGPAMLAATAEARAVLLSMGAEYLQTTPDQVEISKGVISIKNKKKKNVTYGQLAKGQKIEKFLDVKPKPKDYSEYKIMGKSYFHADALEKVTGKALYTGDFRMPGMVWAKILRPPSHFAKLATADTSGAEQIPGVQLVRDKDFIAVLHTDPEKAEQALAKIRAEYTFNEMEVDDKTVFDRMLKIPSNARVVASKGNLDTGMKNSGFQFESKFNNHYVAHSPIEPHTALAWMEGDIMMVRASTQSPFGTQEGVARELGVTLDKVRVIPPFLGGGFGGKAVSQQATEAARLSKLSGKPVMVAWTREEEFFYDSFRPAAVVTITSGITNSGEISLWDYHEYFAGSRGSETIYECPDQQTTSHSSNQAHPFATGAWRAPANNTNTYARESQIDMMAIKAGMDPIEFRLKNLKDERMIGVVKALKEFVNWQPAVSPSGRGLGIACGFDAGGYVATMAEVKVDQKTGEITVVRLACVQEIGFCVNPQGATIQMESCLTMGMGYAITEEVEFTGGMVKTSNFGTYKLPRFSWLPKIETKILDMHTPPQGGGEPAIITMGGALANAVFDACGARLYTLPMTPERVLSALAKG